MPYQTEALAWLLKMKNRSKAALAPNYFKTTEDAVEAVKKLYAAGAIRVDVWVDEIYNVQDKRKLEYAETLFVIGPPGPQENRKELADAVRSLYVPAEEGEEGGPGEGPVYELWWD